MALATREELDEIGLRYSSDQDPGIHRKRHGKGFRYVLPSGDQVEDRSQLKRIRELKVPPAWTDVWICLRPNGHVQATGRDSKGRKQSIYHPDFRAARDTNKFHRLREFGEALPRIRKRIDADLRRQGMPYEKALATVVSLLDRTGIRIGGANYAKIGSYGLTTLRNRHVKATGTRVEFKFVGKSGKEHEIELADRRLARIVKKLQDLPGQSLFQYLDGSGARSKIRSDDVNGYLREISGGEFTSKDFRTWIGTVEMLRRRLEFDTHSKRRISECVKEVAKILGNTPAICRGSYIWPVFLEPKPLETAKKMGSKRRTRLDPIECITLSFLESVENHCPI